MRSRLTLSNPCRPSEPVGLARAGGVVHTIETTELLVPEGLDAQTEAIHAGRAEPFQLFCARRLGIHLDGNLGVRGQVEGSAAGVDQGGDLGGLEERRCSTAKMDRLRGAPASSADDLARQGVHIPDLETCLEELATKIAVAADGAAERGCGGRDPVATSTQNRSWCLIPRAGPHDTQDLRTRLRTRPLRTGLPAGPSQIGLAGS